MSSVFRQNKLIEPIVPYEPMIMDFNWEAPENTWFHKHGTAILVLITCVIIYLMCIVWRFSITRVRYD